MDTPNNNEVKSSGQTTIPTGPKVNVFMGILAYVGPFIIVSYLVAKDDPFVKFHIKQGLILVIINLIIWVITPQFHWRKDPIVEILNLAILVLAIIGIVNVVQKKEKMLPVVGSLASYFTF